MQIIYLPGVKQPDKCVTDGCTNRTVGPLMGEGSARACAECISELVRFTALADYDTALRRLRILGLPIPEVPR